MQLLFLIDHVCWSYGVCEIYSRPMHLKYTYHLPIIITHKKLCLSPELFWPMEYMWWQDCAGAVDNQPLPSKNTPHQNTPNIKEDNESNKPYRTHQSKENKGYFKTKPYWMSTSFLRSRVCTSTRSCLADQYTFRRSCKDLEGNHFQLHKMGRANAHNVQHECNSSFCFSRRKRNCDCGKCKH